MLYAALLFICGINIISGTTASEKCQLYNMD
jgi:hypothetical protein